MNLSLFDDTFSSEDNTEWFIDTQMELVSFDERIREFDSVSRAAAETVDKLVYSMELYAENRLDETACRLIDPSGELWEKVYSTEPSLESIGSAVTKFFKSIKNAIKKVFEWIANLFKKLFGKSSDSSDSDKEEKVKKAVKDKDNGPKVQKKLEDITISVTDTDVKILNKMLKGIDRDGTKIAYEHFKVLFTTGLDSILKECESAVSSGAPGKINVYLEHSKNIKSKFRKLPPVSSDLLKLIYMRKFGKSKSKAKDTKLGIVFKNKPIDDIAVKLYVVKRLLVKVLVDLRNLAKPIEKQALDIIDKAQKKVDAIKKNDPNNAKEIKVYQNASKVINAVVTQFASLTQQSSGLYMLVRKVLNAVDKAVASNKGS